MLRKVLLCLGLILLGGASAFSQSTVVSGQITDSGSQSWNSGTYTFTFVPSGNNPVGPYTWTGGTLNTTITGSLTATGSYSVSIPSNSAISPVNSAWSAVFCPQASSPCFTVTNLTITGGTQTVNATPPAILISLQTAVPPVLAYSTTEITGAAIGSQFYLLGAGPQVCQAVSGNNCTTWASAAGTPPSTPVTPAQAQGPQFNVVNYGSGIINDAQHVIDGVTAGSSGHTVTSATAGFCNAGSVPCTGGRLTDVGKKIVCSALSNATPLMPVSTITVVNSTTQVVTNGTDNGAASNLRCIWYTKDAASAFLAAATAATPPIASLDPNQGKTLGALPGTVYCPPGGYAVGSRIFQFAGVGNSIGPSFMGDPGRNHCMIYLIPGIADPGDGFAVLISFYNGTGFRMENITVDGLGFNTSFTHPIVSVQSSQQFTVKNVKLTAMQAGAGLNGTLDFNASSNGSVEDVFVQGSAGGTDYACAFHGGATDIVVRRTTCSNHNQNLIVDGNSGTPRSIAGDNGITLIGVLVDECDGGTTNCAVISNGGLLNAQDTTFLQGSAASNYALSVDGTSRAYLSNVSCGVFGPTTATSNCMTIASGGFVAATMSDLRGNDASSTAGVAVNGPAGATFVDLGGNKILHSVSSTISPVTVAQYGTLGFTGGIVPKSTQTHTPNTCYAAGGNLLATSQNLCTILLDQNYQLLNITAGQNGTAVTTACTGAPVVTLSDGTRSATLTLTTANTSWSSTGLSTIFASGATLTVSIGANTCATPPTGVFVNYVLQSILNP